MAAKPATLSKLWPNTLTKFWGAQAIGWSVASLGLALLLAQAPAGSPGAVLAGAAWALAGANAALSVLLYRTTEEASTALGLSGVASFAGTTALVHGLAGSGLTGAALSAARTLRLWHVAMTVGSVAFALIKSNKDRLFAQGGDLVRSGMLAGTSRGAAVPLLVIINQGAGAKLGAKVGAALRERAERVAAKGGAMRVVDVAETPPAEALASFGAEHAAYRVLVCGGDGTVTWVLQAIDDAGLEYRPAVGVLPLGTGNDLARVLGWGKSYRTERLGAQLDALDRARIALLDRWTMAGTLPQGKSEVVLCNYCSIGVDAKAALLWARLSKARPALFKLRLLNKLWYIVCGSPEFVLHSYRDLGARVFIECDGKPVALPPGAEGIMVLNTPSYGGGSDLWDEGRGAPLSTRLAHMQTPAADTTPAAMSDGRLEVVAVTDVLHLASSLGGFSNGVRLCQGATLRLYAPEGGVPLQVDGEPFNVDTQGDGDHPLISTASCEPFDFTLTCDRPSALMLAAPPQGTGAAALSDAGAGELAIERGVAAGAVSAETRERLLRDMAS